MGQCHQGQPDAEKEDRGAAGCCLFITTRYEGSLERPEGVITYVKSSDDTDALVWLDKEAQIVTESQLAILRAAKCEPDTPPQSRAISCTTTWYWLACK